MAHIVYSRRATQNLAIIARFYKEIESGLALRVMETISQAILAIGAKPTLGRPSPLALQFRERSIRFGGNGFIVLYEYLPATDIVVIAAIRHQRQRKYLEEGA